MLSESTNEDSNTIISHYEPSHDTEVDGFAVIPSLPAGIMKSCTL